MEHGENAWQNPPPTPSSGSPVLFQSQVQAVSLTHRFSTIWAMPLWHFTSHHPPPRSCPACSLYSALRTFPLGSKKPLYRSLCLPGVPYFISFLWGIPSHPQNQLKCQPLWGFSWLSWVKRVHSFAQMLHRIMFGNVNSAVTLPAVKSSLCYWLAGPSYLASLCLGFLDFKMEIIIIGPTSVVMRIKSIKMQQAFRTERSYGSWYGPLSFKYFYSPAVCVNHFFHDPVDLCPYFSTNTYCIIMLYLSPDCGFLLGRLQILLFWSYIYYTAWHEIGIQ